MIKDPSQLPDDLPVPIDDGACDHLPGLSFPSIPLRSTSGGIIDLSKIKGTLVIYFYPMNGHPDSPPMVAWNDIPGARGCTPQACAFSDAHTELTQLGVTVMGISSQPLKDQQEARTRLALPFDLLNDQDLKLAGTLRLPTFEYASSVYIKRITLIVEDCVIQKVFYPVFPPDRNALEVLDWLKASSGSSA